MSSPWCGETAWQTRQRRIVLALAGIPLVTRIAHRDFSMHLWQTNAQNSGTLPLLLLVFSSVILDHQSYPGAGRVMSVISIHVARVRNGIQSLQPNTACNLLS